MSALRANRHASLKGFGFNGATLNSEGSNIVSAESYMSSSPLFQKIPWRTRGITDRFAVRMLDLDSRNGLRRSCRSRVTGRSSKRLFSDTRQGIGSSTPPTADNLLMHCLRRVALPPVLLWLSQLTCRVPLCRSGTWSNPAQHVSTDRKS